MALLQIGRDQTSLSGGDGTIEVNLPLANPNQPLAGFCKRGNSSIVRKPAHS